MRNVVIHGDCVRGDAPVLALLEAESVDAVVCDPPYHLTAMTKRFGKDGRSGGRA